MEGCVLQPTGPLCLPTRWLRNSNSLLNYIHRKCCWSTCNRPPCGTAMQTWPLIFLESAVSYCPFNPREFYLNDFLVYAGNRRLRMFKDAWKRVGRNILLLFRNGTSHYFIPSRRNQILVDNHCQFDSDDTPRARSRLEIVESSHLRA